MNLHHKMVFPLFIYFFISCLLCKPIYAIFPQPTNPIFEKFIEKINKINKNSNEVYFSNIPKELKRKDSNGSNILHITIENENYIVLEYILSALNNRKEYQVLKEILESKNSSNKTALRLAIDSNKMKYADLIASFGKDAKTNILEIDPQLLLDALKTNNPNPINFFFSLLEKLINNMLILNDDDVVKRLLLHQDNEGNTFFHLLFQNKILTEKQKSTIFCSCWLDNFDINLQNNIKKSILDYAAIHVPNEIIKHYPELKLPLKLAKLKNNLEELKLKLIKLQVALKNLQNSLVNS